MRKLRIVLWGRGRPWAVRKGAPGTGRPASPAARCFAFGRARPCDTRIDTSIEIGQNTT